MVLVTAFGVANSGVSAFAASNGCNNVNGGVLNRTTTGTNTLNAVFDTGDKLVLTLTKPIGGLITIGLSSSLGGNQSKVPANNGDTLSLTLTAGAQTVSSSMTGGGEGAMSISVTCIAGAASTSTSIQSSLNPSTLGDAVTFTAKVSAAGGVPTGNVTFTVDGASVATVALAAGSAHFTTSTLTAGTHPVIATYNGGSSFGGSTSPTLNQDVGSDAADSERLRQMQIIATKIVAQTSGESIQGAIDTAISDGFDENGNPITAGDSSMHFNFAAEPKAMTTKAANDEPLDPLAFDNRVAGKSSAASAAEAIDNTLGQSSQSYGMASDETDPTLGKRWRPWVNIRDTGWTGGGDADVEGNQVNALAGVTYKISPKLLVGLFGGYEDFSYSSTPLDATLDGHGWTAGAYLGWLLAPKLRFDAGIAHSMIDYSDTAGSASGEFDGKRWFFTSSLTGTHQMGAFVIEPSAKIYALWEDEDAYTDSLGTLQPARDFTTGRASGGFKVAYPVALDDGGKFVPFAGIYADYYFSDDEAAVALTFDDVIDDGWSARFTGGFSFSMPSGVVASLSGEVGGVGSDGAEHVSGRASLSVPF